MLTGEWDAIGAARSFLASRGHAPWDETTLMVERGNIEGREAWIVHAADALPPGDPEWMHPDRRSVLYFVEVANGRLFGVQAGSARTILD